MRPSNVCAGHRDAALGSFRLRSLRVERRAADIAVIDEQAQRSGAVGKRRPARSRPKSSTVAIEVAVQPLPRRRMRLRPERAPLEPTRCATNSVVRAGSGADVDEDEPGGEGLLQHRQLVADRRTAATSSTASHSRAIGMQPHAAAEPDWHRPAVPTSASAPNGSARRRAVPATSAASDGRSPSEGSGTARAHRAERRAAVGRDRLRAHQDRRERRSVRTATASLGNSPRSPALSRMAWLSLTQQAGLSSSGHALRPLPSSRHADPALQALPGRRAARRRAARHRHVPEHRFDDGTDRARLDRVAFGKRQPDAQVSLHLGAGRGRSGQGPARWSASIQATPTSWSRRRWRPGASNALAGYPEAPARGEVRPEQPHRPAAQCADKGLCYVEVKNVHFSRRHGLAEFPNSVTARGVKHLAEMSDMVRQGHRAVMVY